MFGYIALAIESLFILILALINIQLYIYRQKVFYFLVKKNLFLTQQKTKEEKLKDQLMKNLITQYKQKKKFKQIVLKIVNKKFLKLVSD